MKNTIIVASIAIFVIGLLLWGKIGSSRPTESTSLATGSTSANVSEQIPVYDFGPVSMMRGNVEHEFTVTNTTDADLTITKIETTCMCTRAVLKLPDGKEMGPFGMPGHGFSSSLNAVVRPGEKLAIRAIFDPAAHGPAGIGKVERAVILETSNGPITMQFRAEVTP